MTRIDTGRDETEEFLRFILGGTKERVALRLSRWQSLSVFMMDMGRIEINQ